MQRLITDKKQILIYGVAMAGLLYLLKWLELRLIIIDHAFEIYAGSIALMFTLLGIWLAVRITAHRRPLTESASKPTYEFNIEKCERLNISKRELEVLQLIAKGLSNQEIAAELFVSLNTVKSHVARLFEKLEVKRRTQAMEKSKQMGILQ